MHGHKSYDIIIPWNQMNMIHIRYDQSFIWYDWFLKVSIAQPIDTWKHNQEKSPRTLAYFMNVSTMFDNHKILLFQPQNKQTFHMFLLLDLHLMLCSWDLDVLRAQSIMVFFILITHKTTRSESSI